jgi:hypothetical protein
VLAEALHPVPGNSDKGIYQVNGDELMLNYGTNRPSDFNDTKNSFLLELARSDDPACAPLRSLANPLGGAWRVKRFISFGTPVGPETAGVQTFIFGTERLAKRIDSTKSGDVDLDVRGRTIAFKTKGREAQKQPFQLIDDVLFISLPGSKPNVQSAIYRREMKK